MFDINTDESGTILFAGRLDTSQVEKAKEILAEVTGSPVCDFSGLEYISSSGLGLLLETQRRLMNTDNGLRLTNMNQHIRNIFKISGMEIIFDIE